MTDTPGVTRLRPLLQNPAALQAARLDAGLTARQLAERAGISVSLVREAERGRCSLSRESLKRVEDALGCQEGALAHPEAGRAGTPRPRSARPPLQNATALLAARIDAGMTIGQVAKRAGVSPAVITSGERGERSISVASLKRLADAFGRPVRALMNAEAVGQEVVDLMSKQAGDGTPARIAAPAGRVA